MKRVLIIDDDPQTAALISKKLNRSGFETQVASTKQDLDQALNESFDAFTIDQQMRGMQGIELVGDLRELSPGSVLVMVTGHGDEELAVTAMKRGLDDYLVKDVELEFLNRLPETINKNIYIKSLEAQRRKAEEELEKKARELEKANRKLAKLAFHDQLTGLANRHVYQDRILQALRLAHRRDEHLALVYVDLDDFKGINDTYGHPVGDEILKATARRIKQSIRESDTAARLGGDEFSVLLEDIDCNTVDAAINKILENLARPVKTEAGLVDLRASFGYAVYPDDAETVKDLLKAADDALYQSKRKGKNRVARFLRAEVKDSVAQ